MFVQDADKSCLRQGDILEGIPFPLLKSEELVFLGKLSPLTPQLPAAGLSAVTHVHRNDPNWLTAQIPVRISLCMVISQCCYLEPRNRKISIPTFAVARLVPLPKRIRDDLQRLASLRANKDPLDRRDPGYINLFYVHPHERIGRDELVADFNQMIAIPGTEFPRILEKKILQLTDVWRVKFKIKLAASMARLTDDEINAGLEKPWIKKKKTH